MTEKTFSELQNLAHQTARDSGFHTDRDRARAAGKREYAMSLAEQIALVHSEASEALEDIRYGRTLADTWHTNEGKPMGLLSELADIVIRVMDMCGYAEDVDLAGMIEEKLAYNATRGHKHGKAL